MLTPKPAAVPETESFTIPQQVAQEVIAEETTLVEEIEQSNPPPVAVSHEAKAMLAYEIWEANGGIMDDPLTLEHWLDAESELVADTPETA